MCVSVMDFDASSTDEFMSVSDFTLMSAAEESTGRSVE